MQSLWQTVWRRWLDSRSLRGVDHLCDHLRRDIGIDDIDRMATVEDTTGQPIRERIVSANRTLSVLHTSR